MYKQIWNHSKSKIYWRYTSKTTTNKIITKTTPIIRAARMGSCQQTSFCNRHINSSRLLIILWNYFGILNLLRRYTQHGQFLYAQVILICDCILWGVICWIAMIIENLCFIPDEIDLSIRLRHPLVACPCIPLIITRRILY